jgi:hypothetical protein
MVKPWQVAVIFMSSIIAKGTLKLFGGLSCIKENTFNLLLFIRGLKKKSSKIGCEISTMWSVGIRMTKSLCVCVFACFFCARARMCACACSSNDFLETSDEQGVCACV